MKRQIISITLLVLIGLNVTLGKRAEPHSHSEVKVVGYDGPLAANMFTLFKSAELVEFIDCNFTSVPSQVFSLLPKVEKIFVKNTTIEEIHPTASHGTPTLKEFYFLDCVWGKPYLESWNGFTNLEKLVIKEHHNDFPFVELKANSLNNTSLKHLEMTKCGVEKIDDLAFNNLNKLETLILRGNKLKTITKEMLAPLKSLKKLDLQKNQLESLSLTQIPELPELESINLANNPLKSLSLSGIEKLAPKLKNLDVSHTEIPDSELESLAKSSNINIVKQSNL